MLRDRYAEVDIFAKVPQLSQAIDPVLAQLDALLDDDALFQQVQADLSRRYPHTLRTGRPSTPVEVVLRLLVIKHLYAWSYAQTEQWVADSLVLRDFCRIYWQAVPDDTTLLRWANLIQPATLHTLLDHIVALAQQLKVTRGRKLRTDGTVVETNSHAPTDSGLLNDGVRVLSRLLGAARDCLGETAQQAGTLFRDRTRSARRLATQIIDTRLQVVSRVAATKFACRLPVIFREAGCPSPALSVPPGSGLPPLPAPDTREPLLTPKWLK